MESIIYAGLFIAGFCAGILANTLLPKWAVQLQGFAYWVLPTVNAVLSVALYRVYSLSLDLLCSVLMVTALLMIFVIDLKHQIIPDELNLFLGLLGVITLLSTLSQGHLIGAGLGMLLGGGFFFLLAVLTGGAMGGGDIKMMAALGLTFGLKGVFAVALLSFSLSAVVSLGLVVTKKKGMKDFIPFGPFIVLASVAYLIFEKAILLFLGYG